MFWDSPFSFLQFWQSLTTILWQVNPGIRLEQFSHTVEFQDNYNTDGYDLSYPGIILKITRQRNIGYFIIQTFIPSALFVGLGKLSSQIYFVKCPTKLSNNFTTKTYICLKFFGQSNIHVHKHETYLEIISLGNTNNLNSIL